METLEFLDETPLSPASINRILSELPEATDEEDWEYYARTSAPASPVLTPKSRKRASPALRRSPSKQVKKQKKVREQTVKPAWFIQNGAVVPAEKRSSITDPRGYDYLLSLDWESPIFPYSVLEGRYKGDKRLFVFGKENEETAVFLMLNRKDGRNESLESFDTSTQIATRVIAEVQSNEEKQNKARLSGYDYLKLRTFQMEWMPEPQKNMSLKQAQKKIEARVKPASPAVRDANDLYGFSIKQEVNYLPIKQEENMPDLVENTPLMNTKEESLQQYAEFLQVPANFTIEDLQTVKICPEEGLTLTNGETTISVGPNNLISVPEEWPPGKVLTDDDLEMLQNLLISIPTETRPALHEDSPTQQINDQMEEAPIDFSAFTMDDYLRIFGQVENGTPNTPEFVVRDDWSGVPLSTEVVN